MADIPLLANLEVEGSTAKVQFRADREGIDFECRDFSLALKPVCRNIATINRTRKAGGFSGRLSPGNQLTPAHISIDIAAASIPIGHPQ